MEKLYKNKKVLIAMASLMFCFTLNSKTMAMNHEKNNFMDTFNKFAGETKQKNTTTINSENDKQINTIDSTNEELSLPNGQTMKIDDILFQMDYILSDIFSVDECLFNFYQNEKNNDNPTDEELNLPNEGTVKIDNISFNINLNTKNQLRNIHKFIYVYEKFFSYSDLEKFKHKLTKIFNGNSILAKKYFNKYLKHLIKCNKTGSGRPGRTYYTVSKLLDKHGVQRFLSPKLDVGFKSDNESNNDIINIK